MISYIVDAFTNIPFKGNPAGVCIVETPLAETTMQAIAAELNLSETAFVHKHQNGQYSIRYFSPKVEVPLCGHATLACSKVLFEDPALQHINFMTIKGLELKIHREDQDIIMEFPTYELVPATVPPGMLKAIGIDHLIYSGYNKETNILMVEVRDAHVLAALSPDYNALVQSIDSIFALSVTAVSTNGIHDFHSRLFWPWSGSDEDPVTGGSHTFLAPYWSKKLNKYKMKSFQSSARTGSMELELIGKDRLWIKSQAVIVFKGNLNI